MIGKKVVVTTAHRGVFFGTLRDQTETTALLADARNCLYWSKDTKGFLGLASIGPQEGSRVGPAVPELSLRDVTSISLCTDEAAEEWEIGPWN